MRTDAISRKDARRLHCKICRDYCTCYRNPETCEDLKAFDSLPPVKPNADVDSLINKIETEFSSSMYDDWGNTTSLHDGLVDIIREWAERSGEENK